MVEVQGPKDTVKERREGEKARKGEREERRRKGRRREGREGETTRLLPPAHQDSDRPVGCLLPGTHSFIFLTLDGATDLTRCLKEGTLMSRVSARIKGKGPAANLSTPEWLKGSQLHHGPCVKP